MKSLLMAWLLLAFAAPAAAVESVRFRSADGLEIHGDRYPLPGEPAAPVILLFHQAGASRGEYEDIAPRLNRLGFECIAVDLRSGRRSRGKENRTAAAARAAGRGTSYADALPDVLAALDHARRHYPGRKIILWGSSYSAALVLKVAGDRPGDVAGVVAFSPGEYFAHLGKGSTWIQDSARHIQVPVFISSARDESDSWRAIYDVIPSKTKTSFVPTSAGHHGSSALWKEYRDSEAYWQVLIPFLLRAGPGSLHGQ